MSDWSRKERERMLDAPIFVEGRVPPHDLDAEAAVLAAVMIDPLAMAKVTGLVEPEHFYSESHRRIFEACVDLAASNKPIDVVQVGTRLKETERIQQVGGMGYLTEILNAVPFVANVEAYARTVAEKWQVRQMIFTCQRGAAEGYVDYGTPKQYLEGVESAVYAVVRAKVSNDLAAVGGVAQDVLRQLGVAAERGEEMTGISTGFDRLDRMTAGLHDGDVTVIAARPGMGKSSLVVNVATNVASPRTRDIGRGQTIEEDGFGVCIFSLEMPKEQLATRMICCEGRVDISKLRTPKFMGLEDWNRLTRASVFIHSLPIWIDDTPAIGVMEVRAKVRRKQAEYDRPAVAKGQRPKRVGLVVIDYMQLMSGEGESRESEVSRISRELKAMAKELRVPVVVLAQLNRECEMRKDKRPQLSDLRESGAIEQDADNILFIYRDDYYNPNSAERSIAELLLAKQRNGPTGTGKVRWNKEFTLFENLAEGEYVDEEPG